MIHIFKFTHLKLTKNRICLSFIRFRLPNLHSKMSSLDRAFVIAIIDCVSFIVVCPAAADDPTRQRSRTSATEDAAARVDREHS